ncbi:MAG: PEP-CTERM sorting domain-containing protein [Verrucomicrobiae bacterium]|nr:PEP-CTERM sorting domain-containing protein [Verrucomicrobiae bacterium]
MKTSLVSCSIRMLLPALALLVPSGARATNFVENFDGYVVGTQPPGWTISTQGGLGSANVDSNQFVSASNSLAMYVTNFSMGSTYLVRYDLGNQSADPFSYFLTNTVSVEIRQTYTNQFFKFAGVDGGALSAFEIQFNQGTLKAINNSNTVALVSYSPDEWYRVDINTRPVSATWSANVYDATNGLLTSFTNFQYAMTPGTPFYASGAPIGLFLVNFGTIGGSPATGTTYVDNLFVGQIPEPGALALTSIGILGIGLLVRRPRR